MQRICPSAVKGGKAETMVSQDSLVNLSSVKPSSLSLADSKLVADQFEHFWSGMTKG